MRKSYFYAFTAAAAMTAAGAATVPMTAHAAVNTYSFSGGNGKAVVISGSGMADLNQVLSQIGGNWNSVNCENGFPGIQLPGNMFPGSQVPGDMLPDNSLPIPDFGDQGGTGNGQPDSSQPGDMLPDNSLPIPDFGGQGGTGNEQPDSEKPGVNQDNAAAQVVKLVNEERAKAGLAPLTVDNTVTNAAQKRAHEIETSFSHTRPNGSDFSTALKEAGVNYRSAGENIAYGQDSAARVMQDWMNSAGHRANILNGSFTKIGVGHYKSASGVDYWTQLFTN